MNRFQPQQTDDHNAPTEPLNPFLVPPYSQGPQYAASPWILPPQEGYPYQQPQPAWNGQPQAWDVAPDYQPAWEQPPSWGAKLTPVEQDAPLPRRSWRLRTLFTLIGPAFFLIQMLLLAYLVISLLHLEVSNIWAGLAYNLAGFFIWPFTLLWPYMPYSWLANSWVSTFLALLVYGLLWRIIGRTRKLWLRP